MQVSHSLLLFNTALYILYTGEQAERKASKEVERLKRQLAKEKQKHQRYAEAVQGKFYPHHTTRTRAHSLRCTPETYGDVDLEPESEEGEESPPMQFSNAVSADPQLYRPV
jgi:hypothetical protein